MAFSFRALPFVYLHLLFVIGNATRFSFEFNQFSSIQTSNCRPGIKAFCASGDASLRADRSVDLTAKQATSAGWLYYSEPIDLWDKNAESTSFSTSFTFTIDSLGKSVGEYGDGIAFFIKPSNFLIPAHNTSSALGLVISQDSWFNASGDDSFLAVEIDTHTDGAWDDRFPHVGIDVNSLKSQNYERISSFIVGDKGLTGNIQITYDANSKNLSVTLSDASGNKSVSLSHVVDLKGVLPQSVIVGLSASTSNVFEINQISSWKFESTLPSPSGGKKKKVWLSVGISAGGVVILVLISLLVWWMIGKKPKPPQPPDQLPPPIQPKNEMVPRRFTYEDLKIASSNFNETRKLGEGGFGPVYRGCLPNPKLEVAIKVLGTFSTHGVKQYLAELKVDLLQHDNIVKLIGWCHEQGRFLLVYEFMPNSSLDVHLFNAKKLLPWTTRYRIALGLASGLHYLHAEWDVCIIHRDIKSSNIMLDAEFNAKIGDFGLARLTDHNDTLKNTTVAGTFGYLAPEYFTGGKASNKSDVYSFGVVLLEIACGRKCIDHGLEASKTSLVDWVWRLYGRNLVVHAADNRLGNNYNAAEMKQVLMVGLWCVHPDPDGRPTMKEAIKALEFQRDVPDLPKNLPVNPMAAPVVDSPRFEDGYNSSTSYPSINPAGAKRTLYGR